MRKTQFPIVKLVRKLRILSFLTQIPMFLRIVGNSAGERERERERERDKRMKRKKKTGVCRRERERRIDDDDDDERSRGGREGKLLLNG